MTAGGIKVYVDGNPVQMKVLADNLYRPFRNAGKQFKEPFRIGTGWGAERRFHGNIDDVLLYDRALRSAEVAAMALEPTVAELAAIPAAKRTEAQSDALRWSFLEQAAPPVFRDAWSRVTGLSREREALERKAPTVMVMEEKPGPATPAHLLQRGAYDKPGPVVERNVPAVLPPLPTGHQ